MNIRIETIPHNEQRYETVGDWQFIGDDLVIRVSDMESKSYAFLVGIHELIEAVLCKNAGVTEQQVDKFDMDNIDCNDPGSLVAAPYYRQHLIATMIERMLADELNIDWTDYEDSLEALFCGVEIVDGGVAE